MTPSAITLVPREECLRSNPLLAHEVIGWQRAVEADSDPDNAEWWAGARDEGEPDPRVRCAETFILYVDADTADEAARETGPALGRMIDALGGTAVTALLATRRARWPTRRREPPVLARAARELRAFGAGKGFSGGIRAGASAAGALLEPLLWSVRMEPDYGLVFLAPDRAPFVATLCQYLNLHVDVYDAGAVPAIRAAAREAGFVEPVDGGCAERFSSGGIPGRRLAVDVSRRKGRG